MSTRNSGDGDQQRPDEPAKEPEWTTPQLNVPEPPDLPSPQEPPPPLGPRPGSIQRQEPGVTQPRPPTVAEARARDKARKRAADAQRAAQAAADAKKRTRNRVLIGGIAIVGVAGLVGGGYLAYRALTAPDEVTAYCVQTENGQELVVEDKYCGPGQAGFVDDSGGSHSHAGPIIIYGGGPQYRYYYGGSNTVGKPPVGGSTLKPKGAQITTKSGTTIQRGGLGSKSTGGGGS
ncbi:hypothetical protein [Nocardia sp. bgisy134]|uniref:hypothetical protein n=1 Tax=unclassified Nocardia TaxID=2637762 RepID=UPI003D760B12